MLAGLQSLEGLSAAMPDFCLHTPDSGRFACTTLWVRRVPYPHGNRKILVLIAVHFTNGKQVCDQKPG